MTQPMSPTDRAVRAGERYASARLVLSLTTAFIVLLLLGLVLYQQTKLNDLARQNRALNIERQKQSVQGQDYATSLLQQILTRLDASDTATRQEIIAACRADADCRRLMLPPAIPPSKVGKTPPSQPGSKQSPAPRPTHRPKPKPSPTPTPTHTASPSPSPTPTPSQLCVQSLCVPPLPVPRGSVTASEDSITGSATWMLLFWTPSSSQTWTATAHDWRRLLLP